MGGVIRKVIRTLPWEGPVQVNITKRIDTPEGKRYCPVVGPNGRIKPDWVMVDGCQEKHPEGAYYLDWTEEGKRSHRASSLAIPSMTTLASELAPQ